MRPLRVNKLETAPLHYFFDWQKASTSYVVVFASPGIPSFKYSGTESEWMRRNQQASTLMITLQFLNRCNQGTLSTDTSDV